MGRLIDADAIRISTQYEMIDKNFNIQIHFAVFHFRWRWVDGN